MIEPLVILNEDPAIENYLYVELGFLYVLFCEHKLD